MNLMILLILILLSIVMFITINYLTDKNITRIDTIIIPNISMIILASLFTKLKDYMILFLIFYLVIDFIYTFLVSKKSLLIDNKNYYINSVITFILGLIIYEFFLLKVRYAYVDMEVFKNFIWVMIIMYFYNKLNIKNIKLEKYEQDNYKEYYKEFVLVTYIKLKNKYSYLIKTNNDIENIIYSFLIYDIYKKNKNIFSLIKDKFNSNKTIEENIVELKEMVENKYKRIKNNKIEIIIKNIYKNKNEYDDIVNILEIINEIK